MKILLVSSFLLFERTRFGGSRRLLNIARALKTEHDLSVICFDGCREWNKWDKIHPFENFLAVPPLAPNPWKFRHFLDASRELKRNKIQLESFLQKTDFDCVILGYAQAPNILRFPAISTCPNILYIEGDLVIGQIDAARHGAKNILARLKYEIRFNQINRYYRSFLKKTHTFFMSTQTEIQSVHQRFPGVRTKQLGHGIELNPSILPQIGETGVAGFIGNFQHTPNLDALVWFLEMVHPKLRLACPNYRLLVAGMNLPDGIREECQRDCQIIILGAIQTLEEFYGQISFLINPIVTGKGVRTKVIEAAAFGRAIVSTRLGADGSQPLNVRVGDSPEEFFCACREAIQGGVQEKELLENRITVSEHFSPSGMVKILLEDL